MARGLSLLQRRILVVAFKNYLKDPKVDCYDAELLAACFGWTPRGDIRADPSRPQFSRKQIGEKQYNCARASLCRCVSRLEDRNLVRRVKGFRQPWSGIKLTISGVRVSGELAVKTAHEDKSN